MICETSVNLFTMRARALCVCFCRFFWLFGIVCMCVCMLFSNVRMCLFSLYLLRINFHRARLRKGLHGFGVAILFFVSVSSLMPFSCSFFGLNTLFRVKTNDIHFERTLICSNRTEPNRLRAMFHANNRKKAKKNISRFNAIFWNRFDKWRIYTVFLIKKKGRYVH